MGTDQVCPKRWRSRRAGEGGTPHPQSAIHNRQSAILPMPLFSKYLTHARLSRISQDLGREVLDLGCGYGELLDYLPSTVSRIVLVDRSPVRQEAVEKRIAGVSSSAAFLVADIDQDQLARDLAPFDTI